MKRIFLYPFRLLAFGAVLLWDAIIPRRKPREISVSNETGRRLVFEYHPDANPLVVKSHPDIRPTIQFYDSEED